MTTAATDTVAAPRPAPGSSLYQDAWRRIRRDRLALLCLIVIGLYTLVAIAAEAGWLFPNWGDTIGDRFEMKNVPPGTTVYAHEISAEEEAALPPEVKPHKTVRDGREVTYRLFRGRAAASAHYYRGLATPLPERPEGWAVAGLADAWSELPGEVRAWVVALPAEQRERVVAAGPLLWERLERGGLPVSVVAREHEHGVTAYYERESAGLDRADSDELSPAGAAAWDELPAAARGWMLNHPSAERGRLVRAGPACWRGVAAAGFAPAADGSAEPEAAGDDPGVPASAEELWRAAATESLAGRSPALVSWLHGLDPQDRSVRLDGGVRALAEISITDIELGAEKLEKAGYWKVHTYLCGSDSVGRDALRLVIHGTKISMKVGLITSLIAIPIGLLLGALAGYFGGRVDDLIVWVYTTLACVPGLLLILAIAWSIGGGLRAIYIALGATTWVQLCRLIRGEFLKIREQDYVVAAVALGAGHARIIGRHMIPNAMHLVIITFSLRFVYAILSEVVLSYIGIGVDVTQPSWGRMISSTQGDLAANGFWWVFTFTSLAMFFIVLALNVFGDALRDALDPKLRT